MITRIVFCCSLLCISTLGMGMREATSSASDSQRASDSGHDSASSGNILFDANNCKTIDDVFSALTRLTQTLTSITSGLDALKEGKLHLFDPQVADDRCQIRALMLITMMSNGLLTQITAHEALAHKLRDLSNKIEPLQASVKKFMELKHKRGTRTEEEKDQFKNEQKNFNKLFGGKYSLTELLKSHNITIPKELLTEESKDLLQFIAAAHGLSQSQNGLSVHDDIITVRKLEDIAKKYLNERSNKYLIQQAEQLCSDSPEDELLKTLREAISTKVRKNTLSMTTASFYVELVILLKVVAKMNIPIVFRRTLLCPECNKLGTGKVHELLHLFRSAELDDSQPVLVVSDDRGTYEEKKIIHRELCENTAEEHTGPKNDALDELRNMAPIERLLEDFANHPQFLAEETISAKVFEKLLENHPLLKDQHENRKQRSENRRDSEFHIKHIYATTYQYIKNPIIRSHS